MRRRFVTVDVFTEQMFGGNPLGVVLDAEGLTSAQMQSIAAEFNYSETTFVLPPRQASNTARVRIFTPRVEVPFAGHPNVGTAFALARLRESDDGSVLENVRFEEAAGLVPIRILRANGTVVGAEFRAPETLSIRSEVTVAAAAACLTLQAQDLSTAVHAPVVVSVGLPMLVVEVGSRAALQRARPSLAAHAAHLPCDGADCIFAYAQQRDGDAPAGITVLQARMFAPLDGVVEDPATGSAVAATIALLAQLAPEQTRRRTWRVHQGVAMGRPSLILGCTDKHSGQLRSVEVSGHCVAVMQGSFVVQGASESDASE